jgi:thiamine pyrophosphokinase
MPAEAGVERTIIILSGGGPGPHRDRIPPPDLVIAADSGLELASDLGLTVDLIVGDLDSVAPATLAEARNRGIAVEQHPAAKDATDLEIAFEAAVERGATRIAVVGGGAGRLDHLLGVATLVASPRWDDISVEWHTATGSTYPTRTGRTIDTTPTTLISLIPIGGDAVVSATGTRWTLDHDVLPFGTSRGISNEATEERVTISVHSGTVLVVSTP